MHFQSTVLLFFSALSVATAQSGTCSQLAGYRPAVKFCGARFPAPIPTVTRTTTKSVTVKATTTSIKPKTTKSVTVKATTTSIKPNTTSSVKSNTTSAPQSSNARVRTITAVTEVTVTNCDKMTTPACPSPTPKWTSPSQGGNLYNRGSPSGGRNGPREAEPEAEADPQFGQWGQALTWARVLASGYGNVQSVCSCIRPAPKRTVTVSATATVTATAK